MSLWGCGRPLAWICFLIPSLLVHPFSTVPPIPNQVLLNEPTCRASVRLYSSSDYLHSVREALSEAGLEGKWKTSAEILSDSIDIDFVVAEDCLARTWKWRSWAVVKSKFAKKFIKPVLPDDNQIVTALTWLREGPLQLPEDILQKAVTEFPESYLMSPEATYHQALATAPRQFSNPEDFRILVLKNPSVFMRTYNCEDDGCASECGNCWVSFAATQ